MYDHQPGRGDVPKEAGHVMPFSHRLKAFRQDHRLRCFGKRAGPVRTIDQPAWAYRRHVTEIFRLPPATKKLGRSRAWGVQYHPEFDLPHIASIYEGYGDELIGGTFFDSRETLDAHIAELHAVAEMTEHSPLAWKLGIDRDLPHGPTRRTEVRNWLRQTADAS